MWYRYFLCGIGKNRCDIGISDVVSEIFRYVPFPIPHRKLFLTVRHCSRIENFNGKITLKSLIKKLTLPRKFHCLKNKIPPFRKFHSKIRKIKTHFFLGNTFFRSNNEKGILLNLERKFAKRHLVPHKI
jgi:hypothetical protein